MTSLSRNKFRRWRDLLNGDLRAEYFFLVIIIGFGVGISFMGGGGCAFAPVSPAAQPVRVAGEPNAIWQACLDQLRQRGFRAELADRRSGLIISYPLVSRQWFEFWCQDVVTSEDLLESSLNTVRRIIQIEMADMGDRSYGLYCRAVVERLWRGAEIVGGQVRAREILGESVGRIPVYGSSEPSGRTGERWLPVGEDHALESSILHSIGSMLMPGS